MSVFTIDGEGIVTIARQLFHDEQKERKAVDILENAFDGISQAQMTAVLNGDASITRDCEYIDAPDPEYKAYLINFIANRSNTCTKVADKWVSNHDLAQYIIGLCRPLFATIRSTYLLSRNARYFGRTLMPYEVERIIYLEEMRDRALATLIESAGFDEYDMDGYTAFIRELDTFVEQYAGTLVREPERFARIMGAQCTMNPDEILYNSMKAEDGTIREHDEFRKVASLDDHVAFTLHKLTNNCVGAAQLHKHRLQTNDIDLAAYYSAEQQVLEELKDLDREDVEKRQVTKEIIYDQHEHCIPYPNSPLPTAKVLGDGIEYLTRFARAIGAITRWQIERNAGTISKQEYVERVAETCLPLIQGFVGAILQHGPLEGWRNDLFMDLATNMAMWEHASDPETAMSIVFGLERVRGFIHEDEEVRYKFLIAFPLTQNYKQDRETTIDFFNALNTGEDEALAVLTR